MTTEQRERYADLRELLRAAWAIIERDKQLKQRDQYTLALYRAFERMVG